MKLWIARPVSYSTLIDIGHYVGENGISYTVGAEDQLDGYYIDFSSDTAAVAAKLRFDELLTEEAYREEVERRSNRYQAMLNIATAQANMATCQAKTAFYGHSLSSAADHLRELREPDTQKCGQSLYQKIQKFFGR